MVANSVIKKLFEIIIVVISKIFFMCWVVGFFILTEIPENPYKEFENFFETYKKQE